MSRFVILEHDDPFLHWDFMLETGDVLRTWRLLEEPVAEQSAEAIRCPAESLADHRLEYLDYEGEVSRDRGSVHQWDAGLFVLLSQNEQHWEIRLEGKRLSGFASLIQKKKANENSNTKLEWEFCFLAES